MVQLMDLERVMELICQRKLQPRDFSVMGALITQMDTYTCRVHTTAETIAGLLGMNPSAVRSSMSRLKKEHQLRLIREARTGNRYYLLNPWTVRAGKSQAVGMAMQQFKEA